MTLTRCTTCVMVLGMCTSEWRISTNNSFREPVNLNWEMPWQPFWKPKSSHWLSPPKITFYVLQRIAKSIEITWIRATWQLGTFLSKVSVFLEFFDFFQYIDKKNLRFSDSKWSHWPYSILYIHSQESNFQTFKKILSLLTPSLVSRKKNGHLG